MLKREDTAKIIAVKDDKIIITHQKQPRKKWFYDFPGGRNDSPSENELDAAKREMAEETGMIFRSWRLVAAKQPFAKIDWLVYTFIATDFIAQGPQNLDGGELIGVEEVSFDQLKRLAKTERRFSENEIIKAANSLDDLLNLPAIYTY